VHFDHVPCLQIHTERVPYIYLYSPVDFWPLYTCEQTPCNDGAVVDGKGARMVGGGVD